MKQYLPILDWLGQYKKSHLSGDLFAGITVGVLLIPQGMAYAMIAGLPPVFGLYAALIPQLIYACTGTSRQLAVGPVAMDSLLVAAGLGALSISGLSDYISMAIFLALFTGIIQLIFGLFRMGFLVNFISRPVISGFTSAAAIIIGLSQLKHLLGTEIVRSNQVHKLIGNAWKTVGDTNMYALAIGGMGILIIYGLKQWNRKIPGSLIVLILGILVAYFTGWQEQGLQVVGAIPKGLPAFGTPQIDASRIAELFPIALTLALIAYLEAISISKSLEERHDDYEVEPNQELIALGLTNIIGSFFQSYSTTGSFSRSAINDEMGAQTGLSLIISALVVGITLLFLTPLFYYLPNAILAAIIMVAVIGLIDFKYPKELLKYQKDEFFLLLLTFLTTLLIGIKEGILLGVLLSLLLFVYRTSMPHTATLGRVKGTDYFKNINRFSDDVEVDDELLIFRFDAQLYFGNKGYFKQQLYKHIEVKGKNLKAVIINAESINYIDSTALKMLHQVLDDLEAMNIHFYIAEASGPTRDILFKTKLIDRIGKNNLFVETSEAVNHFYGRYESSIIKEKVAQQTKKKPS
ncbi:MAG: solute carrier family 26 protein [Saprospiraceae bacterium]|nr:solute carrier family 26 protein [Saprospiraceae bacterium]